MRTVFLLTLMGWLVLPMAALTQPVFSPGEVVLNSGDTLRGFIAELGEKKRYDRCFFKRQLEGEKITYGPEQLQSFRITDRYYFESRSLVLPTGDTSQVFMLLALKGEVQVLKYGGRLFWEMADGRRQEAPTLQNQKADSRAEKYQAGQLKFDWYQFLDQLQEGCPALAPWYADQEKVDYKVEDLIEIAEVYHDCREEEYEVIGQDIPLFHIDYGISAGPVYSQLTYSSAHKRNLLFLEGGQLNSVGVEVSVPIIFEPLRFPTYFSAYVAPIVGFYNYSDNYSVKERNITFPVNYEVRHSWTTGGLHLGVRYRVPQVQPRLTVQMGFRREQFFNQEFSTTREQVLIREPVNQIKRTEPDFELEYITGQMGWVSQINLQDYLGATDEQWSVSLGYSMTWAFLTTGEVRSNVNTPVNTAARMSTFYLRGAYLF